MIKYNLKKCKYFISVKQFISTTCNQLLHIFFIDSKSNMILSFLLNLKPSGQIKDLYFENCMIDLELLELIIYFFWSYEIELQNLSFYYELIGNSHKNRVVTIYD